MQQLQSDLPELTLQVAHERLGWECQSKSVIQISKKHRLTRARVYQHLDIPVQVLHLRLAGRKRPLEKMLDELFRADKSVANNDTYKLMQAIFNLFFVW